MSARPWYGFAGLLLAAIMFAAPEARADDTTTLPTVVITGTFVTSDGIVVNCFTTSCQQLEISLQLMYSKMYADMSQGNSGVSKDVFCANLAHAVSADIWFARTAGWPCVPRGRNLD